MVRRSGREVPEGLLRTLRVGWLEHSDVIGGWNFSLTSSAPFKDSVRLQQPVRRFRCTKCIGKGIRPEG